MYTDEKRKLNHPLAISNYFLKESRRYPLRYFNETIAHLKFRKKSASLKLTKNLQIMRNLLIGFFRNFEFCKAGYFQDRVGSKRLVPSICQKILTIS